MENRWIRRLLTYTEKKHYNEIDRSGRAPSADGRERKYVSAIDSLWLVVGRSEIGCFLLRGNNAVLRSAVNRSAVQQDVPRWSRARTSYASEGLNTDEVSAKGNGDGRDVSPRRPVTRLEQLFDKIGYVF